MKRTLLIIAYFVFALASLSGKSPEELLKTADELYEKAEYQNALSTLQSLLASAEKLTPQLEIASYLLAGNIYLDSGQTEGAGKFYGKALSLGRSALGESDSLTVQAMNNSAECDYRAGNVQTAAARHEWVLKKRIEKYGEQHADVADSYNNLGNCNYALKKLEAATDFHKKALAIRQKVFKENHPDLAVSYINLGNCFLAQNRPGSAILYFRLALELRQKILPPDHPKLASVYMSIGKCSAGQDRTDDALNYFKKALKIYQKKFDSNHPKLLNYYETIGDLLSKRGVHREALGYYQKILDENTGQNFYSKRRWVIEDKIGICYQHLGDFHDALVRHKEAINLFEKDFDRSDPGYFELITGIGNAFFRKNDFENALLNYQEASSIYLAKNGNPNPTISNNIGLCALESGDVESAILYFSEAIEFSKTKFENPLFYKNLAVANSKLGNFEEANQILIFITEYFKSKGTDNQDWLTILIEKAILSRKLNKTDEAEALFAEADVLAKKLRNRLMNPLARQRFQASYHFLYKNAVEFYYEKYDATNDEKYLTAAFQSSEKSKSLVLLEMLHSENVRSFAGVPPEILEEEKRLLESINNFNTTDTLSVASPQLEFENFIKKIEIEYPDFFQLKYQTNVADLTSIQSQLIESQHIINYFLTDNSIFVFLIGKTNFDLIRLDLDFPINDLMLQFRQAIDKYPGAKGDVLAEAVTNYNLLAHHLYELVFKPISDKFELPEDIILIPDGILNYLPFECLLTEKMGDSDRFKSHPYLLRKHKINYAFSASMFLELNLRKLRPAKKQLLSVAPTFKNNAFGLNELRYNIPEAEFVSELWGGDLLKNEEANLPDFLERAADYRVLLFATHGEANARAGEYSWLAFTYLPDTIDNDLLYAKALYERPMSASLVVLSACETGIGEYRQGEGVLSLARGFFYAGAQSIIPTLWSVDDARNSEIIQSFFTHLDDGKTVSSALHSAKIDFLKNRTHDESHPVFWAAPIVVGLPDVDTSYSGSGWISGLIGAFLLGGLFFFFWKRRL